jgi:hypothetical protein
LRTDSSFNAISCFWCQSYKAFFSSSLSLRTNMQQCNLYETRNEVAHLLKDNRLFFWVDSKTEKKFYSSDTWRKTDTPRKSFVKRFLVCMWICSGRRKIDNCRKIDVGTERNMSQTLLSQSKQRYKISLYWMKL